MSGEDRDRSWAYRTHHWDRRSFTMAIVLLLVFAAAVAAVWSTLTTDHDAEPDFLVTPSPTMTATDDGTATPVGASWIEPRQRQHSASTR